MSTPPTELDVATRQALADEVERLVRMGMDRKKARRVVWDDYLDELAAYTAPPPAAEPEPPGGKPSPPETPEPESPAPETEPVRQASEAPFFTPERLAINRAELSKVKQLVGLRRP